MRSPVKVASKGSTDGEEAVKPVRAVGAAMHDHAPGSRHTCMPIPGRRSRSQAAHAVPPESGCVKQVQVVEEGSLCQRAPIITHSQRCSEETLPDILSAVSFGSW